MLYSPAIPDVALEIAMLTLAVLWDTVLGEPKRLHPVAGMGRLVSLLERQAPQRGRALPFLYGLGMAVLIPGVLAVAAHLLTRWLRPASPLAYVLVGGYILKGCFSVRELGRAASRVRRSLETKRWGGARQDLRSLVSRDTADLTPELMASATVESVAENTTDSFVAPWLAFALFGLPGAVAYRAINTLDSMIGYRKSYEYVGKATARLDDLVNLIPARLAALLIVAAAYLKRLSARRAWQAMLREHGRTESPNAGWTMSAMAGALGVELHKVGHYRLGRPLHPIGPSDIQESVSVMRWVTVTALIIALGMVVLRYGVT